VLHWSLTVVSVTRSAGRPVVTLSHWSLTVVSVTRSAGRPVVTLSHWSLIVVSVTRSAGRPVVTLSHWSLTVVSVTRSAGLARPAPDSRRRWSRTRPRTRWRWGSTGRKLGWESSRCRVAVWNESQDKEMNLNRVTCNMSLLKLILLQNMPTYTGKGSQYRPHSSANTHGRTANIEFYER